MLNVKRLLVTCPTACDHHQKLVRNLVSVLANKILIFNDKITHISKRTTREKLLSYLSSESIKHSSLSFDIPFDRKKCEVTAKSWTSYTLSRNRKSSVLYRTLSI